MRINIFLIINDFCIIFLYFTVYSLVKNILHWYNHALVLLSGFIFILVQMSSFPYCNIHKYVPLVSVHFKWKKSGIFKTQKSTKDRQNHKKRQPTTQQTIVNHSLYTKLKTKQHEPLQKHEKGDLRCSWRTNWYWHELYPHVFESCI